MDGRREEHIYPSCFVKQRSLVSRGGAGGGRGLLCVCLQPLLTLQGESTERTSVTHKHTENTHSQLHHQEHCATATTTKRTNTQTHRRWTTPQSRGLPAECVCVCVCVCVCLCVKTQSEQCIMGNTERYQLYVGQKDKRGFFNR